MWQEQQQSEEGLSRFLAGRGWTLTHWSARATSVQNVESQLVAQVEKRAGAWRGEIVPFSDLPYFWHGKGHESIGMASSRCEQRRFPPILPCCSI